MSATRLIQAAIYSVLSADSTLAGLSLTEGTPTVYVYNDAPDRDPNTNEAAGYPYVLIQRATETPWHTMGSSGRGWNNIVRVHVFSRYQGDIEALRIRERIVTLLDFQSLTVDGYATVLTKIDSMQIGVTDIEKAETRHDVIEVRVRVHV